MEIVNAVIEGWEIAKECGMALYIEFRTKDYIFLQFMVADDNVWPCIVDLMNILEAKNWKNIVGKAVRIETDGKSVNAIMHAVDDSAPIYSEYSK